MARKRTGPTKAVKVISASEIAANPEKYRIVGNVAKPVAVEESTRGILGGAIEDMVYVISDADIASGKYGIEGGAAQVVVDSSFLPSRKMGGTKYVTPVYVVAGSFPNGYISKVLSYSPSAYWPLDETSGTNADNAEGTAALDGTYTGVTLNSSTGPDGQPAGLWGGILDYCDIYNVGLNAVFDGSLGTLMIWIRAEALGDWTDSIQRRASQIQSDSSNYIRIGKSPTDNQILFQYNAGGTLEQVGVVVTPSIDWIHCAITWNKAGDVVKYYVDGVKQATEGSGLGVYANALDPIRCNVGSNGQPSNTFKGYLTHCALWDTVLSDPEILDLATV